MMKLRRRWGAWSVWRLETFCRH